MKVTIEVTEEDYQTLSKMAREGRATPHDIQLQEAYEKEKNKIQVGDWVKVGEKVFCCRKANNSNELFKDDIGEHWNPDNLVRLSQPLQDMLNKEIEESSRTKDS